MLIYLNFYYFLQCKKQNYFCKQLKILAMLFKIQNCHYFTIHLQKFVICSTFFPTCWFDFFIKKFFNIFFWVNLSLLRLKICLPVLIICNLSSYNILVSQLLSLILLREYFLPFLLKSVGFLIFHLSVTRIYSVTFPRFVSVSLVFSGTNMACSGMTLPFLVLT